MIMMCSLAFCNIYNHSARFLPDKYYLIACPPHKHLPPPTHFARTFLREASRPLRFAAHGARWREGPPCGPMLGEGGAPATDHSRGVATGSPGGGLGKLLQLRNRESPKESPPCVPPS